MKKILLLLSIPILFSCSMKHRAMMEAPMLKADMGKSYVKKVDNFIIVTDLSSSTDSCSKKYSNFSLTTATAKNIVGSLPGDIEMNSAFLSFGHAMSITKAPNMVNIKMGKFQKGNFLNSISSFDKAGGTSRADLSLKDAAHIFKTTDGKSALILISDGEFNADKIDMNSLKAVKNLCIYTIQAGNSITGEKNLKGIASSVSCGKSFHAEDLLSKNGLKNFMETALIDSAPDSDKDGVPDAMDQCPSTPAGINVDKNGCPVDSDHDGIPDFKDRCPGTISGVSVDQYGCPLDSDKDGVPDFKDRCAKTPAGVKVDMKGCPVDSDNDGVADDKDLCPDTPDGTIVAKNGCPLPSETESVKVTEKGTWIYNDIQFASGRSEINEKSAATLDKLAEFLNKNKNFRLEVQGHTDNRGRKSYNVRLSQKRADSVRNYLIKKGIAPSRLVSVGYGPAQPIATNKTLKGRTMNRRVEFKPLKD